MPTAKMQATGIAGAVSVLVLWMYSQIPGAPPMPEYVAAAVTALLAWFAGWLTSDVGVKTIDTFAERLAGLEKGMAGIVAVLERRAANDPTPKAEEAA